MKYLALIVAQLGRKKLRTILTMLSVGVAYLLLGLLSAIDAAFNRGVELSGADRLVTIHKYSIVQLLPESYANRMLQIKGVEDVANGTWFGGFYQDPKNFIPKFPVEPEKYMKMYPEYKLSKEEMEKWKSTRTGAVVGLQTAERFGWKVGDRIPIEADIWPKKDGSRMWEFDLVGIYRGEKDITDTTQFLFRYDYFDETRAFGKGQVGWYIVRVQNPAESERVARQIDALFANSPAETKTSSEEEFNKEFAKQLGDIGTIVRGVLSAVFFTILLVVGNTISQSVRERTHEFGVLKTIGFSDLKITFFVIAEGLVLILIPTVLGVIASYLLLASMSKALQNFLPSLSIPAITWTVALASALILGLITALPPAMSAMKLKIADALGRA